MVSLNWENFDWEEELLVAELKGLDTQINALPSCILSSSSSALSSTLPGSSSCQRHHHHVRGGVDGLATTLATLQANSAIHFKHCKDPAEIIQKP